MSATHYRHSGRFSILLLPVALAAIGVGAVLLAVVYAYSIAYCPFMKLAFILPLLYGAGLGALVGGGLRLAKMRNAWLTGGITFLVTLASYALSWIVWTYAALARADQDIPMIALFNPFALSEILGILYDNGTWSIGWSSSGGAVNGPLLGFCWVMEALFVVGVAPLLGGTIGGIGVYCEGCDRWCDDRQDVMRLRASAADEVSARLGANDVTILGSITRAEPTENPFLRVDLDLCGGCGGTNALTLRRIDRQQTKNGEQVTDDVLVDRVVLGREQAEWVARG